MQKPIKEILFNSRLQYRAYFYPVGASLSSILPKSALHCKYGASLLPTIPEAPQLHPAAIFAWTLQTQPQDCIEQPAFVKLMHDTIRDSQKELEYLLSARAKKQDEGHLALVDERAPMAWGRAADSDDTIGMCRVANGELIAKSYEPMPTYRLISRLGIFSLPRPLYTALMAALTSL